MARSFLNLEAQIWRFWATNFFKHLMILLTDPILSHSPKFGRPKQGQKFVVPTFHIHFLNPECIRIPCWSNEKWDTVFLFNNPRNVQKRRKQTGLKTCTHQFSVIIPYKNRKNWLDLYDWVDIKLCHWVPKVPFWHEKYQFFIVYFYLKYER